MAGWYFKDSCNDFKSAPIDGCPGTLDQVSIKITVK